MEQYCRQVVYAWKGNSKVTLFVQTGKCFAHKNQRFYFNDLQTEVFNNVPLQLLAMLLGNKTNDRKKKQKHPFSLNFNTLLPYKLCVIVQFNKMTLNSLALCASPHCIKRHISCSSQISVVNNNNNTQICKAPYAKLQRR